MANHQSRPSAAPSAEIRIHDNFAGGEYSNVMEVRHSKEEFLMTFLNVAGTSGRVCAKIITSPGHIKRMIEALAENLKKYELQFGPVAPAESPKEKIGF